MRIVFGCVLLALLIAGCREEQRFETCIDGSVVSEDIGCGSCEQYFKELVVGASCASNIQPNCRVTVGRVEPLPEYRRPDYDVSIHYTDKAPKEFVAKEQGWNGVWIDQKKVSYIQIVSKVCEGVKFSIDRDEIRGLDAPLYAIT